MAKKKANTFSITITLGDKVIHGSGDTVLEALLSLPKPAKIMSKGIFRMTYGDKKTEQLMFPTRLKRLFYAPNYLAIHAKQLQTALQ